MTMQFVQFADDTEKVVISVFGCAQDATFWPNQGEIDDTDSRYLAFEESITPKATTS